VIGIDDVELARMSTPALTTARIPKADVGAKLVQLLLDQVEGVASGPRSVELQTELIVRESTGSRC